MYSDHVTTCRLTTVSYVSEHTLRHNYTISRDFATDVCKLPLQLDNVTNTDYFRFIDEWGTVSVVMVTE